MHAIRSKFKFFSHNTKTFNLVFFNATQKQNDLSFSHKYTRALGGIDNNARHSQSAKRINAKLRSSSRITLSGPVNIPPGYSKYSGGFHMDNLALLQVVIYAWQEATGAESFLLFIWLPTGILLSAPFRNKSFRHKHDLRRKTGWC